MTDLVDQSRIEDIVGVRRHPTRHYIRFVSSLGMAYILHATECLNMREFTHTDLRTCPFSRALDRGWEDEEWAAWEGLEDRPVLCVLDDGVLVPVDQE